MRQDGTEWAGSGAYDKHYEPGIYYCASSGIPLYSSENKLILHWLAKFLSGYRRALDQESRGPLRHGSTEIRCAYCDATLAMFSMTTLLRLVTALRELCGTAILSMSKDDEASTTEMNKP